MLNKVQILRMYEKQKAYVDRMEQYIFTQVGKVDVSGYITMDKLHSLPQNVEFKNFSKGDLWGTEKVYCWFKGSYTVPKELDGKKLYLMPECSLYEGLLFVNELPYANFSSKFTTNTGHGNHYCKVFVQNAVEGETYDLVLEAYAGHDYQGCMPYEAPTNRDYNHKFDEFRVMVQDELIKDFFYSYKIIIEIYEASGEHTAKRAEIERLLIDLNKVVYFSNEETSDNLQREAMVKAIEMMKPVLSKKNSETVASLGILGHSHMDTAWLWEIDETIKKCARTFANQINMMDQFPDYHFMQSSAAHLKFIETYYPNLFEKIKEKVAAGQYEPNGGVFIECDCNITGGEYLIRHFLWGQRYTKEKFNYLSNSFFLPDTFGYSAAIPQILKGVGIDYFLTTKMGWNDTNTFPYVTYKWQGLDGTQVFAHHNITHNYPTPKKVVEMIENIPQKSVSNERLLTYGFGDGGGGPEDSSAEIALRLSDVEGCPKLYDTTLGEFMVNLEKNTAYPNVHSGELYLELHRGTLTNQHTIKRNNRLAEIAIHNAEYMASLKGLVNGEPAKSDEISPLVETLLINQFHDILPGTSLPEVHDRSIKETTDIIEKSREIVQNTFASNNTDIYTLINTISSNRNDVIELPIDTYIDVDCKQQIVEKLNGEKVLRVSGVEFSGFGSKIVAKTDKVLNGKSEFVYDEKTLKTPFANVSFAENGTISSFIDTRVSRELKGKGRNLNTFLFGEDLSLLWDNWDIDADAEMKLEDTVKLVSREVVADGAVEFRIRSEYEVSDKTTMKQDMIFYSDNARVDFETVIDWNDKHRLLKTEFDISVHSDYVTQEIQYGNVRRTTTRNNSIEQAQFEVCNHKYTDMSEPAFGISILNDCKYGISAENSALALTLHKGGCKPDPRGDRGVHEFKYAFFPHEGGFKADTVVTEGYLFNYPVQVINGEVDLPEIMNVDSANIIVECVKPCEDNGKAIIVRLYESEGSYTRAKLNFNSKVKKVTETDMLENEISEVNTDNDTEFGAYQIKTFKLEY